MTLEQIRNLNDEDFKQLIGVKPELIPVMLEILEKEYEQVHENKGRHTKLSREDELYMTLRYLRQYGTQKELAKEYSVGEATVCDRIRWVENTLIKSERFHVIGKKALKQDDNLETVIVDVTESPIYRPKKNNKIGILEKASGM